MAGRTRSYATHWEAEVWYMYSMMKTTVYLPRELKRALARTARRRACSEAVLIREGVTLVTREDDAPAPTLPLFRASGASIAEDIDDALDGFVRA